MNAITGAIAPTFPHVSQVAGEMTTEYLHEALENCGGGYLTDNLLFAATGLAHESIRWNMFKLRRMGVNVVRVRASWDGAPGGYRLERGKAVGAEFPEVAV